MSTNTLLKTPLYEEHKKLGARLVDFGGWALPVNYTSQLEEHHAVRNHAGMFDVSHMTVSDITGSDTIPFLSMLLANDIHKITHTPGKALYSCMLNEKGGVIDDLIVYYLNNSHCRMITNAATNQKDMAWLQQQATHFKQVTITEKPDLALIAVQGPEAINTVTAIFDHSSVTLLTGLKRFQGGFNADASLFIGRTGYTGEDGVEIILPSDQAPTLWNQLHKAGVQACGLGARDTLRLEAGMALYGSDLSEDYTPLDSGLGWTVAMKDDRNFIGRQALETPANHKMIGLMLEGKGVLRSHQILSDQGKSIGEITSGTFSPSLGKSIALARINNNTAVSIDSTIQAKIRDKQIDARIVSYPFIKKL